MYSKVNQLYTYVYALFFLEKDMVTHSSTVARRIPWTEEPAGMLQAWGRKRVGHD